jgi:hypothetical protein
MLAQAHLRQRLHALAQKMQKNPLIALCASWSSSSKQLVSSTIADIKHLQYTTQLP